MTELKEQRINFVEIMDLFLNVKIKKKNIWDESPQQTIRTDFFDEEIAMNEEISKEKMEGEGELRTLEELEATES